MKDAHQVNVWHSSPSVKRNSINAASAGHTSIAADHVNVSKSLV